ncbi:MAG: type II toxin-antitoxin system RelE/ParE family toxin [Clostridiales Family XIII bacterium]|jgi:plasmid stabilization system protein ParE|nr:type II toxin-antitoxin system RelE/ParE family toxin [Clostridiales Family XIII bacterium]
MGRVFLLRYLPLFEEDLAAARDYIALNLQNPKAALRLIEDTEKAICNRLENPLIYAPYFSLKDRRQPYYRINIRKFAVFYVVIDNVMEVRRFVYSKRNLHDII